MSRFIDLVETFNFTTLTTAAYNEKIDGLLQRFPKYEKDDRFRIALPHKSIKTADDYVSMKFCTVGRFPIFGIYRRRDFDLVGVCVEGNIMYALDDCDLHPSFVPDLNVRKLCLGIRDSHLATRETPSFTKEFMRSAISVLSLGYTLEKKNEWCEAIVLLTGMTTQAVRFHKMKRHITSGLRFKVTYDPTTCDGRHELHNRYLGMQSRWNKFSKAIRRGEYPYVYSIYSSHSVTGVYSPTCMVQFGAREEVALINDKNKTKREIFKRRIDRWNGPLGNSKRKRKEQHARMIIMERLGMKRNMQEMDNKFSERMHGFWYGSMDSYRYEGSSVNCLPRPGQIVRANRFAVSATSGLVRLQDVLQVGTTLAYVHLAVKKIWNEGGLLAFFRDILLAAIREAHRPIVDCTHPVFSAAFYLCSKRRKLQFDKINLQPDFNSVSTSMKDLCHDHFGILKEKMDQDKVKWNREPRSFVQLGCGRISGTLGATCVHPLQTRMQVRNFNATYTPYSGVSDLFRRSLQHQHEGLRGFYMTALKIWTKVLLIKK